MIAQACASKAVIATACAVGVVLLSVLSSVAMAHLAISILRFVAKPKKH